MTSPLSHNNGIIDIAALIAGVEQPCLEEKQKALACFVLVMLWQVGISMQRYWTLAVCARQSNPNRAFIDDKSLQKSSYAGGKSFSLVSL